MDVIDANDAEAEQVGLVDSGLPDREDSTAPAASPTTTRPNSTQEAPGLASPPVDSAHNSASKINVVPDLTSTDNADKSKPKKGSSNASDSSTPPRNGGYSSLLRDHSETTSREASVAFSHGATPSRTLGRGASTPQPSAKLDPKTLLSPRKETGTIKQDSAFNGDGKPYEPAEGSMMTSMLGNLHNVQDRTELPSKRRKVGEVVDIDEDDDATRKKSKFEMQSGGGFVSDFIREEREKQAKQVRGDGSSLAAAIVLDDEPEEEGKKKPGANDIVCLGKLEICSDDRGTVIGPKANLHAIPHQKQNSMFQATAKSTHWPGTKVSLKHETHLICHLKDHLGFQFGKLDAATAKVITPLLAGKQGDASGIDFRCILPPRKKEENERPGDPVTKNSQSPLQIRIFSYRFAAKGLGKWLRSQRCILRDITVGLNDELYNPHNPATFMKKDPSLAAVHSGATSAGFINRTIEEVRNDVDNMFVNITRDTESLPQAEQPAAIKTELLAHQKQALYFMTEREKDHSLPSTQGGDEFHLWKSKLLGNGKKVYYNVITGTEMPHRPPPVLGGILADMMGLGKTLSILSLILTTMSEAEEFTKKARMRHPERGHMRKLKSTLLVCPVSTISNWEKQVKDHIQKDTMTVYVYHGASRSQDINCLARYDVIITTYGTVAAEWRRSNSPIFQNHWFRVALDEAHQIRNASTTFAMSINDLEASRRWAVTGTPVQNRLEDLGSLIKFLRIKPFDEKGAFAQHIIAPFKAADTEILSKLRLLVDSITLRRVKNTIDLPAREDLIEYLHFTPEERELYQIFVSDSAKKVKLLTQEGKLGGRSYAHVLRAIMRLRLICAHGEELLNDEDRRLLQGLTSSNAIVIDDDGDQVYQQLDAKQIYDMMELLSTASMNKCLLCNEQIVHVRDEDEEAREDYEVQQNTNVLGYLTADSHLVCSRPKCLEEYQNEVDQVVNESRRMVCPYCESPDTPVWTQEVKRSVLDEEADRRARIRADPKLARQQGFYRGPHTKTKKLIEYLQKFEEETQRNPTEPPVKSVVFSAWTSHLDLIQIALTNGDIPYTRLDGSMSRTARAAAINNFTTSPSIRVILVSIGAGGLGLNLTAASKVFMMEPQFNPAAEAQAVDRVHRLGQKRDVEIRRFIMSGSFEERMLEMQGKKVELAELAVNRKSGVTRGEKAKEKLESLKSLFR